MNSDDPLLEIIILIMMIVSAVALLSDRGMPFDFSVFLRILKKMNNDQLFLRKHFRFIGQNDVSCNS
ncbi:MAG: hypothetical protein Ct9H90mP13_05630 [Pseudomonadota bacterium]|nr:MAG: hypothetical protein Ct9H90mP13_05630 [Pseudomonadota bacterium]